jgi:hypothetical protein
MDGFRLILTTMDGVKAYTRHGNEVSARFPELKQAFIPDGTVLDGEFIVTDNQGRPDFELVMKRLQARNPVKIQQLAPLGRSGFYSVDSSFVTASTPMILDRGIIFLSSLFWITSHRSMGSTRVT